MRAQPCSRIRVAHSESVARAAGETDEPFVQLLEQVLVEARRQHISVLLRTRVRMRVREQTAEVRVALRRLDKQRHMCTTFERDLGAGDRPHAEVLRRVGELEGAVDPIVVGQCKRWDSRAQPPAPPAPRARMPVKERVGAVGMELDIARP